MITDSLGDIQQHSRWQSFKNVGLALDPHIKGKETGLISIQVLLVAFSEQLQRDHVGCRTILYSALQAEMTVARIKITCDHVIYFTFFCQKCKNIWQWWSECYYISHPHLEGTHSIKESLCSSLSGIQGTKGVCGKITMESCRRHNEEDLIFILTNQRLHYRFSLVWILFAALIMWQ